MTLVPGISDNTLYWIIGITAFLLECIWTAFVAAIAWSAGKKPGAVIHKNLDTNEKMHVDPDSLRPASVVGTSIITKKYGPWGLLSKDITIPEPFVERDGKGQPMRFISPKEKYHLQVNGEIAAEIGKVAGLGMELEEVKIQLMEEKLRNQGMADKQLDDMAKRQKEMIPYMNLKSGSQRGGSNAYNRPQ
jgi:hypothetical protein